MTNHHIAVYINDKCVWFFASQNETLMKDIKIKKYKGLITPPLELE